MMNIIGGNYEKHKIYNNVYEYTCEEGYHFESCGVNYGRHIFIGSVCQNYYVIKKDKDETE